MAAHLWFKMIQSLTKEKREVFSRHVRLSEPLPGRLALVEARRHPLDDVDHAGIVDDRDVGDFRPADAHVAGVCTSHGLNYLHLACHEGATGPNAEPAFGGRSFGQTGRCVTNAQVHLPASVIAGRPDLGRTDF